MKHENLNNQETAQLGIGAVSKRKYWYATDVYTCVLCGREKRYKQRVYNESEKETKYIDEACGEHFM
jgi:hypothetical protein